MLVTPSGSEVGTGGWLVEIISLALVVGMSTADDSLVIVGSSVELSEELVTIAELVSETGGGEVVSGIVVLEVGVSTGLTEVGTEIDADVISETDEEVVTDTGGVGSRVLVVFVSAGMEMDSVVTGGGETVSELVVTTGGVEVTAVVSSEVTGVLIGADSESEEVVGVNGIEIEIPPELDEVGG